MKDKPFQNQSPAGAPVEAAHGAEPNPTPPEPQTGKRAPNADFPLPPEWDPNYQPTFVRPSMLTLPSNVKAPLDGRPMRRYWSSKERSALDGAIKMGMRPVQLDPTVPGELYARPNIDPAGLGGGSGLERHDVVCLEMPEDLAKKYDEAREQELIEQAVGLQTSYEDATTRAGGVPVHSLLKPGMKTGSR